MDILEDTTIETRKTVGFVDHVFSLNDSTKSQLLNTVQYVILAIIPIVIMNKLIQNYVPEADYEKDSVQLLIECVAQVAVLFTGMFFIHRIITYIPTYSGQVYGELNLISSSLTFLVVVLGLQTKLGEKIEILFNRVMDLVQGEQPQQQQTQPAKNIIPSQHQNSRADNLGNSSLPQNTSPLPPSMATQSQEGSSVTTMPNKQMYEQTYNTTQQLQQQVQPQTNFDQMYTEPMAANDGGFGGFGSSW